jgi:lysozyme
VRPVLAISVLLSILCLTHPRAQAPVESHTFLTDTPEGEITDDVPRSRLFEVMVERSGLSQPYAVRRLFEFPHDAFFDDYESVGKRRLNEIFGIDLSHYNVDANCAADCDPNWEWLRQQGVVFAYIKASQGETPDRAFHFLWHSIQPRKDALMPYRGPYHFLSSSVSPLNQAEAFLSTVGQLQTTDLPPVLDLEWDVHIYADGSLVKDKDGRARDFWDQVSSPDEIIDRALTWLDRVERSTGKRPLVYTSKAWWDERIKDEGKLSRLARYKIWISAYPKTVNLKENPAVPNRANWAIWQFTDSAAASKSGLRGNFDASLFKGSERDFISDLGVTER